jgi:hypothetical protein
MVPASLNVAECSDAKIFQQACNRKPDFINFYLANALQNFNS